MQRTFDRRRTPIPAEDPIGLTPAYWDNPSRPTQVRAFARRAGLALPDNPAETFQRTLHAFLAPILSDLRTKRRTSGTWPAGGPWKLAS